MSHLAVPGQDAPGGSRARSGATKTASPGPAPVGTPAVEVRSLTIRRGKTTVLDGLGFDIPAGQITGLLGPSGSGKTTLMRVLVGVQAITTGSATVLGRAAGSPALRHEVGYMTQAASVYRDLSVEENVRFFGAVHGRSRAEALAAIDAVGLSSFARHKAADLSGGEFSRVSLACALVAKPRLLILDEPTVGLDPVLRADLWEQFASLAQDGTTLIVSSHVMEEASHCASLLLLRAGALLAQLTPGELRERGGTEDLELAFLHLIQAGGSAKGGRTP